MTIRFYCEDCHTRVKVPDGNEGRPVKCPRCGCLQRVPTENSGVLAHANNDPNLNDLPTGHRSERPSTGSDRIDRPAIPGGSDSVDIDVEPLSESHQTQPQDSDELDPLAELAAIAGEEDNGVGESPAAANEHPLREVTDPENNPSQSEAFPDTESYPPDPQARHRDESPMGEVEISFTPSLPASVQINGEIPRQIDPVHGHQSESSAVASPPPRAGTTTGITVATPLAARPRGIPLTSTTPKRADTDGDSSAPARQGFKKSRVKVPSFMVLQWVTWVLRLFALLTVGGAVKLLLLAIDRDYTMVDRILTFGMGLVVAGLVWGVGEIANGVRETARNSYR